MKRWLVRSFVCTAWLMTALPALAQSPLEAGVVAYGQGDYAAARTLWEQALAAGDWEAASDLGTLYRRGQGVAADPVKAADYYRQAAEHGVVAAELLLAEATLAGQGVPQDTAKAKELFASAAAHGSLAARFRLDAILQAEAKGQSSPALTAPSGRRPAVATVPPPPPPKAPPPQPPAVKAVESPAVKPPEPPVVKPVEPPAVKPIEPVQVPPPPVKPPEPPAVVQDPHPTRVLVASYKTEVEAAQGWLSFNLPGLEPELEAATIPGKGRLVRLYAVGPAEVIHQLCDDPATKGDWCGAGR